MSGGVRGENKKHASIQDIVGGVTAGGDPGFSSEPSRKHSRDFVDW